MHIAAWQARLMEFAEARDWPQFHNPKNLATALSVESAELLEIFQWLTPEQAENVMTSDRARDVRDEVADIAIYLLFFLDRVGVDLETALEDKMGRNEERRWVFPSD
jgi:NTP pyrophosphatase (non-canonical NTP hydrolase)